MSSLVSTIGGLRARAALPIGSDVSVKLAPGVVIRRTGATFFGALLDFIAVLAQRPDVSHMPFVQCVVRS
jgi:hypothetical protein